MYCMRSETFYSTVAQMLPTLLVALAAAFVVIRQAVQQAGEAPSPEELERRYASDNPPIDVPVIMTALAGMLAFFGEMCAVLVLLIGTDGWFPIVAGPFCAIAVLVMTLLVAWILWVQLIQLSAAQPRV
jgi:hypothetical protein